MKNAKSQRGLLLDMDGTLITTESGETFPQDKDDWKLAFDNVVGRIHQFKAKGYKLFIVTNQGGVDANFITAEDIQDKIANVIDALQKPGTDQNYIHPYSCYSMDSDNFFRKPNPGMAYNLAMAYYIDLSESMMIGDMGSDKEFARRAGIGTFKYAEDFFNIS